MSKNIQEETITILKQKWAIFTDNYKYLLVRGFRVLVIETIIKKFLKP